MTSASKISPYDLMGIKISAGRFVRRNMAGEYTIKTHIDEPRNSLCIQAEALVGKEVIFDGLILTSTRDSALAIATFRAAIESARASQMQDNKSANAGGVPIFKISPRVENPAFSEQDMASAFSQISSFSAAISNLPSPNSNPS